MSKSDDHSLTPYRQLQLDFWTAFAAYLNQHSTVLRPRKPAALHYTTYAIGHRDFELLAYIEIRQNMIGIGLVIDGRQAKARFDFMESKKSEIEKLVDAPLRWRRMPNFQQSQILLELQDQDLQNLQTWPEIWAWLHQALERFHEVFDQIIWMTLDRLSYREKVIKN